MAKNNEHVDRARLFLPFDSLKGFREALKEKEKVLVNDIPMTEILAEELNDMMSKIQIGDMVRITYYHNSEFVLTSGILTKKNESLRFISVVKTKINFDEIRKIEIL